MTEATKQRIEALLRSGKRRSEIAREVGVSATTVTRTARLLGFSDVVPRPSHFEWRQVQAYYDSGHTIDECRDVFGFSYGAWDKAVSRGDLVPRARSQGELGRSTRDQVEDLIARGLSQSQIARELSITKSTVAYHVRGLGREADPRFARRHDWAAVQKAIDDEGLSMRACLERFGFGRDTWYRAVRRGDIEPRATLIPLEELLVENRQVNRTHLKNRLYAAGLKEERCEQCGITEWRGKPISLQLHHRNGDGLDNRIENLEILCGNCHSQTENWGGRNRRFRTGRPNTLF